MDALYSDYEILMDDYERVLALESLGHGPNHPAIQSVMKRWVIDEPMVGHESVAGTVIDASAKKVSKISAAMLERMHGWLTKKESTIRKKIDEITSKASSLQRDLEKLEPRIRLATNLGTDPIETGSWTSKVCVEDKVDIEACIKFADKPDVLDEVVKSYTVFTSAYGRPRTRKGESLELRKLGKSSSNALRRASGLIGISPINTAAEAWPLPGNVMIVLRGSGVSSEVVDFAVARDGDYGDTIDPMDKATAERAIKAAWALTEHLKTRNVKRGVFSYTGIYEKIEELKAAKQDEVDKKAITSATKRLRNALAVEDALTTAMVRVCEGLTEYAKRSLQN